MGAIIDELRLMDGVFLDNVFIIRGITGYPVYQCYSATDLRSIARSIHDDEPFSLIIGKDKKIRIAVEANDRIRFELNLIASKLENN